MTPQIANGISVGLIDALGDHLLPTLHAFTLPSQLFFLVLTLLPLFIGNAGHDALVGLGLALSLLVISLLLIMVLLLDLLILLFKKTLLEPLLEQPVGCLLLGLLMQPLELLLAPLLMSLPLLLLPLALLPFGHHGQLLLPSDLLLGLDTPDLLEDVDLGLADQLLLKLGLVLLTPRPLFMREGVFRTVTNLRSLLDDP